MGFNSAFKGLMAWAETNLPLDCVSQNVQSRDWSDAVCVTYDLFLDVYR